MPETAHYRLKLVAVLCAATTFGATVGLTFPLLTLVMRSWGTSETIIGMNSALPGLAAVLFASRINPAVQRFGSRTLMSACLIVFVVCLLAFPLLPSVPAWFVLRFVAGTAQIGIFVVSEIWINTLAPEEKRGSIIGLYSTMLSIGFVSGAMILSFTGINGMTPFSVGALIMIVAIVPYLVVRFDDAYDTDEGHAFSMSDTIRQVPSIAVCAVFAGLMFAGITALLPAYAVTKGLSTASAARAVAWFAGGQVALPLLIGLLADRMSRFRLMAGLCSMMLVCALLLLWQFNDPVIRAAALFMSGGIVLGTYALALTMLGSHFQDSRLPAAVAGLTFLFALGELAGPLGIGLAMDMAPSGFGLSLAAFSTVTLAAVVAFNRRSRPISA